jgi:hypothetical protein
MTALSWSLWFFGDLVSTIDQACWADAAEATRQTTPAINGVRVLCIPKSSFDALARAVNGGTSRIRLRFKHVVGRARHGARAKLTHAGNVEGASDQRQIEGAKSPPRHNRAALACAIGLDDRVRPPIPPPARSIEVSPANCSSTGHSPRFGRSRRETRHHFGPRRSESADRHHVVRVIPPFT